MLSPFFIMFCAPWRQTNTESNKSLIIWFLEREQPMGKTGRRLEGEAGEEGEGGEAICSVIPFFRPSWGVHPQSRVCIPVALLASVNLLPFPFRPRDIREPHHIQLLGEPHTPLWVSLYAAHNFVNNPIILIEYAICFLLEPWLDTPGLLSKSLSCWFLVFNNLWEWSV